MQTKHEKRCPHCAFYTFSDVDLENHMGNMHEKTLNCDYCEFVEKSLSCLKAHITKIHTSSYNDNDHRETKTEHDSHKRGQFRGHIEGDY